MGKKIEIRISGKAYPSLIAACEDNGINPVNVRDYASAHGISEQKAFMVYLASPNGKLGKKAKEWTAEEDKLLVTRAGKIQRFLSQPFFVSEKFTGLPGVYVPLSETLRGFREIIEGKHDDLPESAFLFVGTIDEAVEKAKKGGNA